MTATNDAPEEIVQQGRALYETIRAKVETGNAGKYLVIDVETGEYEIDDDHLAAADRAADRRPGAPLFGMRIGYPTVGRIGGGLRPAGSVRQ